MEEFYCETCERFTTETKCCGFEFFEPEWSIEQAVAMTERLSEEVNLKLTPTNNL